MDEISVRVFLHSACTGCSPQRLPKPSFTAGAASGAAPHNTSTVGGAQAALQAAARQLAARAGAAAIGMAIPGKAAMKREREAAVGEDQMCQRLRQQQEQARHVSFESSGSSISSRKNRR